MQHPSFVPDLPKDARAEHYALEHPADAVSGCLRRVYASRLTTTSGGNLSVIDPLGAFWITPKGSDKGELPRGDVLRRDPKTLQWTGTDRGLLPSTEAAFHARIYQARPDLRAVLHAHPPFLVSFAICNKAPPTKVIARGALSAGDISVAPYALPGSEELAKSVGDAFGTGSHAVIMESHGVVLGSRKSLREAFMVLEVAELCAGIAVRARALAHGSDPKILTPEQIASLWEHVAHVRNTVKPDESLALGRIVTAEESDSRVLLAHIAERALKQGLIRAWSGTLSARVPGGCVISPSSTDRAGLDTEAFVAVLSANGSVMHEPTKVPSVGILSHLAIYAARPEVNFIISSDCLINAMAFGVAAATAPSFHSEVIPEGYLVLRDTKYVPFEEAVQPECLASEFGSSTPIVVVRGDSVYATGSTWLQAFDRLEVLEAMAEAQVNAEISGLGPVTAISGKHLQDIFDAFC